MSKPKPIKYKVTLEVELTDEDLLACANAMYCAEGEKMPPEDVVQWILEPAVGSRLHRLRSALKWKNLKLWEYQPAEEEGYTATKVFDEAGNEHYAMLPNGHKWRATVTRPIEGSWDCENDKNPTKNCWYDDQRDPAWDNCVFCGQPHERK